MSSVNAESASPEDVAGLRKLIEEVMEVESFTLEGEEFETLRAVGRLREAPHEALTRLRPGFEELEHTPFLRREAGQDIVVAIHQVFKSDALPPWPNVVLFVLTILSVLLVGTTYGIDALPSPLTAATVLEALIGGLPTGMLFTVSMLGILGAHEMGHYLMARRHGVRVTLPYFIPFPALLGTMGAIIAMQEPSPDRRVQFDIGVAGPIAGLVVAIPVLVVGLLLSPVYTQQEILALLPPDGGLTQEGNSLLYLGIKYLVFGKFLPTPAGEDVLLHAMAWAGWGGLLVTALNLLPVGQLDGGHVLYGLAGRRAQWIRLPIVIVLLALSFFYQGWLLWAAIVFLLLRRNAPVLDEITDLDDTRRWIGIAMLIVFVLIFVPVPLKAVPLP